MKKILTIVFAMIMLLSCVACSNTNSNDTKDSTDLLPGSKYPLPSELPMEMRPLQADDKASDKKPFENDDPRKKYLEEKYGLTAYLVEERTESRITTLFTLEGYEKTFHLYTKEDLIDGGDDAYGKLFMELQNLDFVGTVSFYNTLQDISGLTNDDLMNYTTSKDYVVSSYPMQQIK